MSNVIIYNPNDSIVSNRVTEYLTSVNTPDYIGHDYTLINPDLSDVIGIPWKYWIYSDGIKEMSEEDKVILDEHFKKDHLEVVNT